MCDLCKLEKKTKWYYYDDDIVICDCITCNVPMVVLREHTMFVSPKMVEKIIRVVNHIFGKNYKFRTIQRTIPDHFHWHIFTEKE